MKTVKRPIRTAVTTVLLLWVFGQFAWIVFLKSNSIDWNQIQLHPWHFLLALFCCLVNFVAGFYVWIFLVNSDRKLISNASGYVLFGISSLSRYLPGGKIWQFASLLQLAKGRELQIKSMMATLLCALLGLVAGATVAVCGLSYVLPNLNPLLFLLFVAVLLAAIGLLTQPRLLSPVLSLLGEKWKNVDLPDRLRIGTLVALILFQIVFTWLTEGVALKLISLALAVAPSPNYFAFLMTSYAIAALSGYVAVFVPAGLGVREGVLVLLLSSRMTPFQAVFVAVSSRLCLVIAELLFSCPLLIYFFSARRLGLPLNYKSAAKL